MGELIECAVVFQGYNIMNFSVVVNGAKRVETIIGSFNYAKNIILLENVEVRNPITCNDMLA